MTQATRRHCPHLWHMWHLPHTRPASQMAQQYPHSSKTLTLKAFQLWDTWSPELTSLETLTLLQNPPKICNSVTVTVSVLGIQELINHRLAHIFICRVKQKHLNTLLHCTSKLPFLPLPLTANSPWCRPVLPRCRCKAFRKKKGREKTNFLSSESYKQV